MMNQKLFRTLKERKTPYKIYTGVIVADTCA